MCLHVQRKGGSILLYATIFDQRVRCMDLISSNSMTASSVGLKSSTLPLILWLFLQYSRTTLHLLLRYIIVLCFIKKSYETF